MMKRNWIIILILFSAALYTPYLLRTIRYDEAYTLHYFVSSPIVALFDWSVPNNHKLYSLAVWFVHLFIGNHLLALRLPAFFAALLSIALVYRLGKLQGGLFAAALLATNPVFADFAVNGRGYTLMIGLTLAFLLAKQERILFWLSIALVLTLPSNAIILLARPKRVVILGLLTGTLFYVPALVWEQVNSSLRFGASLVEMSQEFITIFSGTGVFLLCGILWAIAWRLSPFWRSFYRQQLRAKYSMAGITSIGSRFSASLLVIGLLGIGIINLPLTLGQQTEVDNIQSVLSAQLHSGDSILAGCCANEPLREIYPLEFGRLDTARQFIIPSTFGLFDTTGCVVLSAGVYLCNITQSQRLTN